ncbi:hypothetical protein DRO97_01270 [Archaeoglobales archaeon]|nr:MAG: hypothetical protein DRO97_01270 [Archaeoglobales archaeon]
MDKIIEDILDEKEKILATTNWRESKLSYSPRDHRVYSIIVYATNKRLLYVMHEVDRIVYELPYYKVTSIKLVEEGFLFFKKRYYQIDGDLKNWERKVWRIPANAENVGEFVETVKKVIGV